MNKSRIQGPSLLITGSRDLPARLNTLEIIPLHHITHIRACKLFRVTWRRCLLAAKPKKIQSVELETEVFQAAYGGRTEVSTSQHLSEDGVSYINMQRANVTKMVSGARVAQLVVSFIT